MVANQLLTIDPFCRRLLKRRVVVALLAFAMLSSVASLLNAAEPTASGSDETLPAAQFPSIADSDFTDPEAASFDEWETLVDDDSRMQWDPPELKPIDWVRHYGFRHSSTHGRNTGKGLPLEGTSVLNRPYHFDFFVGPLLGDDLITNRVSQGNVLLGGFRLGWDFDYYWGLEWRLGWADPKADFTAPEETSLNSMSYVVSDIDLIYYPWGDSKVRPYFLVGLGTTQLDFYDETNTLYSTSLATIPFGGGVQFRQSSWMTWRIDIINNLALGDGRTSTMNNVSITTGMEVRFGARPSSYWPWRSSRRIW